MTSRKKSRSFQSKIRVVLAWALLLLVLFISLETAGHQHLDFDHHDCPVCLLGVLPFLGIATFHLIVLWIRLNSVSGSLVCFQNQLFSQSPSSRAPPWY